MKFSVGFLDWLFGEKVKIQLEDGRFRTVTKRWIKKMEEEGLMRKIDGEVIRVNILDPFADVQSLITPGVEKQGHYRQELWTISEDISEETVHEFKDPITDDLYVLMTEREGYSKPQPYIMKRDLWDKAKRQMDAIEGNPTDETSAFLRNMFGRNEKDKKAFVEVLVANSQSIAMTMLEDRSIDNKKYLEVFMEHLYLFLHIADRMAYSMMTEKSRGETMPKVVDLSIRVAIEATCGHWSDEQKAKIYDECMDNFCSTSEEFGQYERVFGDSETGDKDTLLWEFCKNIAKICGCESNLGAIVGHGWVISVALKNIDIESHLKKLK